MKNRKSNKLEDYIDIFMELLPEMIKEHKGKWTIIGEDMKPLGFFETIGEAFCSGVDKYGQVPMLVREVSKEYLEYGRYGKPQIFHSRVSF